MVTSWNREKLGEVQGKDACYHRRGVVAEWSKSVGFDSGVSQRRFESGRPRTVTVTACTLWQGSLNSSATSPMTTSDAETDVKLNIIIIFYLLYTAFQR